MRFVAFDITRYADRAAMMRAGFEFPYDGKEGRANEWWHAQLPNVWQYPIVYEIPAPVVVTPPKPKPQPEPEETEEDEMKPTVHILLDDNKQVLEAALGHPDFGVVEALEPYTGAGTGGRIDKGKTTLRRGYVTTRDASTIAAWLRIYSRGLGSGTSRTPLEGPGNYREILIALSAVSVELGRAE